MKTILPASRTLLLLSIMLTASFSAHAYFPDSSFLKRADSLFNLPSDTQLTLREIKKVKHTYFMVTTCKTIAEPYDNVVSLLKKATSYPEYFNFITKTDRIANKATPNDSVFMFVGGYGLYRVYFFGNVYEDPAGQNARFRIFCGNVDQKLYRKAWKNKVRGFIKIGSHDVDIFWTAEKRSDSTTRVSLTASQAFATPIANWMISIGTNRIFRGMLTDLEKFLAKNRPSQTASIPEAGATEPSTTPIEQPNILPETTPVPADSVTNGNPADTLSKQPAPAPVDNPLPAE